MKIKSIYEKLGVFLLTLIFVSTTFVISSAQINPEEHLKHHPSKEEGLIRTASAKGMGGAMNGGVEGEKMGGMMGEGMGRGKMGGMMQQMGTPKEKDLYPSLMNLPDLPLEKRNELQNKAHRRMKEGVALMGRGFDDLSKSAATDNFSSMKEATIDLKEGLSQFESGLATHQALKEGKVPHNIALQWFKREMGLLSTQYAMEEKALWGLSPFHLFIMAILTLFAVIMIGFYFFKMRRATDLLKRLVKVESNDSIVKPNEPSTSNPHVSLKSHLGKNWTGKLQISRIFSETHEVKTFRMTNPDGGPIPFTFLPGQFLYIFIDQDGEKIKRSYTIASSPTSHYYCEITVKREEQGLISRYLHDQLKEGDLLEVSAASGKLVFTGSEEDSIVLIGGGVGITPLMSVIRYLTDVGWKKDIYFLYSCRTPDDFIFHSEIEYLKARNPNFHLLIAMSRIQNEIPGVTIGRLTKNIIEKTVPEISSRKIHLCGSTSMMESIKSILTELRVPKENLKTESFGPGKVTKNIETISSTSDGPVPTISFKKSGKSGYLHPDKTILEVAEELEIEIDNSCRSGTCGTCKVKLLSGEVTMECEDGLEPEDKDQGFILACQAKSKMNVEVDI